MTHYLPQIISIIGSLIVGFTLWYFQRKKLKLHYYLTETESFNANNAYLKYYTIKLANAGNEMIESILVDISFQDGKIDKITDNKTIQNLKQQDSELEFSIERLNPKDNLNFTITVLENKKDASNTNIKISGKGTTAVNKTESQTKSSKAPFFFLSGFIIATIYVLALDYLTAPNTETKPDRIENIFIILNRAKLSREFATIVHNHDDLSYEGTAFYLTHAYLKDSVRSDTYINALKEISEVDGIAENSKGVIYYLLYKIYTMEQKKVEAESYLEKCKNECTGLYEKLIGQDEFYDLKALKAQTITGF